MAMAYLEETEAAVHQSLFFFSFLAAVVTLVVAIIHTIQIVVAHVRQTAVVAVDVIMDVAN